MAFYWQIKTFRTRENMLKFISKNEHKIQWYERFVNNVYAIEWRDLRKIY